MLSSPGEGPKTAIGFCPLPLHHGVWGGKSALNSAARAQLRAYFSGSALPPSPNPQVPCARLGFHAPRVARRPGTPQQAAVYAVQCAEAVVASRKRGLPSRFKAGGLMAVGGSELQGLWLKRNPQICDTKRASQRLPKGRPIKGGDSFCITVGRNPE